MLALLASLAVAQAAAANAAPPPPACSTEAHAQFDFWVGEWDVTAPGSDQLVARSRIERLHGGCAIREQWQYNSPNGGSSLSYLDPATGRWRQTWVGSSPGAVQFEGGLVASEMVLTGYWAGVGPNGEDGLVRMTYTPNADGSVRQHGTVSFDHGVTWQESFDFLYRRQVR